MDRISRLYNRLMDRMEHEKKQFWPDRYMSILDNKDVIRKPLIIRKALAFKKMLSEMPIRILEDELIVGVINYGTIGMGVSFIDYATSEEKEKAAKMGLGIKSVWGHYLPDYTRVLKKGLKGLSDEIKNKLAKTTDSDGKNFLEAVLICYEGVRNLSMRYAKLAQQMAQHTVDPARRRELEEIAGIVQRVPNDPAQSFREALQSLWFIHMVLHSTMNFVPLGRIDQYLYPYLEKDLKEGRIEKKEAQELLDCFWLKVNERCIKNLKLVENRFDPAFMQLGGGKFDIKLEHELLTNNWLQNVVLGGIKRDGTDATNDLTFMCLESHKKFSLLNPVVSVRLHKGSPQELLKKTCECLQKGTGHPAIYNDDAIIPALRKLGIPQEDANDYSNDGCWEVLIPGKTEFRYSNIEFLQCLELALNKGYSRITGEKEGADTPDPREFTCYDDVLEALKKQIEFAIKGFAERINRYYGSTYTIAPVPFISSLIDDCLQKARDVTQGGAKYVLHAPLAAGVADTANSLAAIKKLVFEDRKISIGELIDLLDRDFEGAEDVRQLLITKAPKYGNDEDYVDDIVKELIDFYVQKLKENSHSRVKFPAGVGTFERYVMFGKKLGATPDGRTATSPISVNMSPTPGSSINGPTSAVKSFSKIDFTNLPAGSPLDLSINKEVFRGEEGLCRLMAFVKSFLRLGGNILTITLSDVETLRCAQREPEKYKDLTVRVGGFQAYFVLMDKDHQDHHIRRAEQGATV